MVRARDHLGRQFRKVQVIGSGVIDGADALEEALLTAASASDSYLSHRAAAGQRDRNHDTLDSQPRHRRPKT